MFSDLFIQETDYLAAVPVLMAEAGLLALQKTIPKILAFLTLTEIKALTCMWHTLSPGSVL